MKICKSDHVTITHELWKLVEPLHKYYRQGPFLQFAPCFFPQTVILNHVLNTETLQSSGKYVSAKHHSIIFRNLYYHGPVRSVKLSMCVRWRCLGSKNEWIIEVYHGLINNAALLSYTAAYVLLFIR